MRHLFSRREVPQDAAAQQEWRAVVKQQRRARRQSGREPVPHHPAARREIEQPIAALDIAMQLLLLDVLEQHAPGAMDDALRNAGRSTRIQDVERMIERHPRERRRPRGVRAEEVIPRDGTRDGAAVTPDIRNNDDALDRRNARRDLGDLVEYRQCLGVVVVAVDCDQQPGLDLPEAIDDALSTEVRRARRPHRPQTRRSEHSNDRFRHVGDDGTDTIAGDDARVRHRLLRARHVVE